jgi:acyl-CoA synthetase (NDP forming)
MTFRVGCVGDDRVRAWCRHRIASAGSFAALARILFVAIASLIGLDIAADYRSRIDAGHPVSEGLATALALSGAVALWRQLRKARRQTGELTVALERARHEAELFREEAQEALRGLGQAIVNSCAGS